MATQVGEAVIKLSFDGKDIKASLNNVSSEAEKSGKSSGQFFGNALTVAAGNLISKGLSTVFSKISSGLDTAIARVDTLKNANKVFTAMGYSAEATSQSMDTLNNYLDGLPTSMTTAVKSVQSLSASFGGIERGTEAFIDMNNAGLAFGATSQQIENAIMQLGQLSLDGPLDAQTWNSLRNDGFSPVFAAMAKEAGVTVGELKEQFGGNGTKTVNDFLKELHKLSTQGGGDMESLADLARKNTDGIGTAMENLQNRIGKAIAKVIDHIGSEKIAEIINNISSHLSDLADIVISVFDFVEQNWDIISPILAILTQIGGAIVAINVAMKAYQKIQAAVNTVATIFSKTISGVSTGLSKVTQVFSKSPIGGAAKKVGDIFKSLTETIKTALVSLKDTLVTVVQGLKDVLVALAQAIVEPIKTLLTGLGEAIAGFFTALADPAIAMGALMLAAAAAAVAAAIFLIGSAIGAVMPALTDLFNNVIIPVAQFIVDTVLVLIDALTNAIINLTQQALIPLGEFLVNSFVTIIQTVAGVITNLTNNALVPLINTLSGAFTNVINAIANLLTGVLNAALQGIAEIIRAVGDGFLKMGEAIKTALEGVQGVLQVFADLIKSIAAAAVAIVAMVTGHSINYGSGYAHLFAQGGKVEGPGTSTSDSIPAMLSDGEYVIRASSAKAIGYDTLDMLNEGKAWSGNLMADLGNHFTTESGSGRIINVYMTNEINNRLDAQEIGRVMMESIRRAA